MPVMDPFEGAKSENSDQKKALLDVIAQSGSAGEKAFKEAQNQVNATRQSALDRATQRAQLTGQNLAGADTAPVTETADRFGNYLGNQNAAFQQNLQGIGASGQSYLEKVNAISPFIQSQNLNKAADRENAYKQAIAQAQAEAEAKAKAVQDQHDFEMAKLQFEEAGRNSRAKAANVKPPSIQAVLGMAQQGVSAMPGLQTEGAPGLPQTKILGGPRMAIGPGTKGVNVSQIPPIRSNVNELATALGNAYGTPNIESIYSPQQQNAQQGQYAAVTKRATPPPTPDVKWLLSNIRGMDKTKAAQALAAPEFGEAGVQSQNFATSEVDDKGKITTDGPYLGLSPRDAFTKYVFSLPGNRSMKDAAIKYYGTTLPN